MTRTVVVCWVKSVVPRWWLDGAMSSRLMRLHRRWLLITKQESASSTCRWKLRCVGRVSVRRWKLLWWLVKHTSSLDAPQFVCFFVMLYGCKGDGITGNYLDVLWANQTQMHLLWIWELLCLCVHSCLLRDEDLNWCLGTNTAASFMWYAVVCWLRSTILLVWCVDTQYM